jgi:hypothetical protein
VVALEKLRDEHDQLIQQYKSLQSHSSYDKAISDQRIESLQQENQSLKDQLSSLSRKRGTLVFELEARYSDAMPPPSPPSLPLSLSPPLLE